MFATFSWVAPTSEFWRGFTFGIRTTERIEPNPPSVPEPATLAPLGAGLLGVAALRRPRRA